VSSPATYVHREVVRFGDLDTMRHVNNVAFLRYFESARIGFLLDVAPDRNPAGPEPSAFGLVLAECHIAYRSPVYFREEVAVGCWVAEIRRSAFRLGFDMHVGERLAADGWGWLVGYDYTRQRARPLEDDLRERLEPIRVD
jgi:acyl-CoA thioester hydrolase